MTGEFEAIGDVATGALAKRAIDGAYVGHDGVHGHTCLNCGTALVGPHCHQCGQSAHVHRTAAALFHDIAHGVFHFEGRTWHTLPLLVARPGELTRRYIDGERVNFVSPMALFLFTVFLMAATFSLVGGLTGHSNQSARTKLAQGQRDVKTALAKEGARLAELETARAAMKEKGYPTVAIDGRIADAKSNLSAIRIAQSAQSAIGGGVKLDDMHIETKIAALDGVIERATRNPELTIYKLQSSAYKFSWALIPISLPFIWLLFAFRRDVGFYDHAIFATYSLSAMTLMVVALSLWSALGVWQGLVGLVLCFFPPWHMYRQLKGTYGLTRSGAILRTVFLIVFAYTSALLFMTLLLAMGLSH